MLLTTYVAGLRLNADLHLHVTDIDSARLTTRVEQGKDGKDRYMGPEQARGRAVDRRTDI